MERCGGTRSIAGRAGLAMCLAIRLGFCGGWRGLPARDGTGGRRRAGAGWRARLASPHSSSSWPGRASRWVRARRRIVCLFEHSSCIWDGGHRTVVVSTRVNRGQWLVNTLDLRFRPGGRGQQGVTGLWMPLTGYAGSEGHGSFGLGGQCRSGLGRRRLFFHGRRLQGTEAGHGSINKCQWRFSGMVEKDPARGGIF